MSADGRLDQEKVTKEKATPTSGSGLRPDFPPSGAAPGAGVQGASMPLYAGTPSPLAASMRLVPLRSTSTRPTDGDLGSKLPGGLSCASPLCCRRGLGRDAGKFMVVAAKAPPTGLVHMVMAMWERLKPRYLANAGLPVSRLKPLPQKHSELSGGTKRPLQEAEWNHCARG